MTMTMEERRIETRAAEAARRKNDISRSAPPKLICCVLTAAVTPVRMGDEKQKEPLTQFTMPLGFIDPKEARRILQDLLDGDAEGLASEFNYKGR